MTADLNPFCITTSDPEPELLVAPEQDRLPFPKDALGPLLHPAQAVADLTMAPFEIGAHSIHAAAALAVQAHADVETLHGRSVTSLFLLTVAQSGERKSTCDVLALKAVRDWEDQNMRTHRSAWQAYETQLEIYHGKKRLWIKDLSNGEAMIEADQPVPPNRPIAPRKLLNDVTYEGIIVHFEADDPSVGIYSDEGGQFLGGHAMNRDNRLKTATGLSKLWDGAPINRTRAGSENITLRHRRASLHLMIQPQMAAIFVGDEELRDQGLMSRMLMAWPQSRIGTRISDGSPEEEARRTAAKTTLQRFHRRITDLLEQSPATGYDDLELAPRLLTLTDAARKVLWSFANQVEADQAIDGPLSEITGLASKAAEQAARMAGVQTLFANSEAEEVGEAAMQRACQLMSWYLNEAKRLLERGPLDPIVHKATKLLGWMQRHQDEMEFTRRNLMWLSPVRNGKQIDKVIALLTATHHILPLEGSDKAWRLNDHITQGQGV